VLEAILLRFTEDSLKGNTKSAAFLLNRYGTMVSGEPEGSEMSGDDREILEEFAGTAVEGLPITIEAQRMTGVVISGVDTMRARKTIWLRSIRYRSGVLRYLDARMGAEVARIYAVNPTDPDDIRLYEKTLYDDADAEVFPCTAAAISYSGFAIASLIGNLVKRLATGEDVPREILLDLKTLTLLTNSGDRS